MPGSEEEPLLLDVYLSPSESAPRRPLAWAGQGRVGASKAMNLVEL